MPVQIHIHALTHRLETVRSASLVRFLAWAVLAAREGSSSFRSPFAFALPFGAMMQHLASSMQQVMATFGAGQSGLDLTGRDCLDMVTHQSFMNLGTDPTARVFFLQFEG